MTVLVVAIPSTALVLPSVRTGGDASIHAMRDEVERVLADVAGVAVVMAADPAADDGAVGLYPPDGVVHLGGLGLPEATTRVDGAPRDLPVVEAHPGADLAVLACAVGRLEAVRSVIAVGVPASGAGVAEAVAWLAGVDGVDALVVAGDLSAGHGPKPPRPSVGEPRAAAHDHAVVAGVRAGVLEPELVADAEATAARGVPALTVAVGLAGPAERVTHQVVDGVGSLIARWPDRA